MPPARRAAGSNAMLRDEDRIFRNLYGTDDWRLAVARKRGLWDRTKHLLARGREAILDEVKKSDQRGRGDRTSVLKGDNCEVSVCLGDRRYITTHRSYK